MRSMEGGSNKDGSVVRRATPMSLPHLGLSELGLGRESVPTALVDSTELGSDRISSNSMSLTPNPAIFGGRRSRTSGVCS